MKLEFELDLSELKFLRHEVEFKIKSIEKMFTWTDNVATVDKLESALLRAKKTLNKIENMIQITLMTEDGNVDRTNGYEKRG
jgi:hypothetical protein